MKITSALRILVFMPNIKLYADLISTTFGD
jgi:hypothetical protein